MKRVLFLVLAVLLGMSTAASATGLVVQGRYFMGTDDMGLAEAKVNGIVASGSADLAGALGAMVNVIYVKDSDFKVLGNPVPEGQMEASANRVDLLATYKLPVEGFTVKAGGGYTFGTSRFKVADPDYGTYETEAKTRGFLLGAAGDLAASDRLTLSGLFLLGVGVKSESEGTETDMGLTTLAASAAYQVTDIVAIQAGYLSNTLTDKDTDLDSTLSGFFLGARATF